MKMSSTIIPTEALNPLGQKFERLFLRAWEAFEDERFDEANSISHRLVKEPLIGDLHKAGCHLILAHSPNEYVWHAEQAVALFKGLYSDPRYPPDEEQKLSQDDLVKTAENVLERAREDAKMYAERSDSPQQDTQAMHSQPARVNTPKLRTILEDRKANPRA
ncbi:hypothetical protein AC579_4888 [Pseudocercospora musae]|uniref:Uncharacterized protein n=1 Tax=Pseudocercospora musae TaxID=113226 RepID=A0A139IKF9_9PEZI|nr:hypothetical protein AC579_4888 [Pseudocercospora musae]